MARPKLAAFTHIIVLKANQPIIVATHGGFKDAKLDMDSVPTTV